MTADIHDQIDHLCVSPRMFEICICCRILHFLTYCYQTITLHDSLSIQHLGKFLNLFHEKHPGPRVARHLVEPFAKGRPNLAMCHEHEILHSVLYFYMMDESQPLPTVSEVLLCSETTTVDEVERFMRRAMCETGISCGI